MTTLRVLLADDHPLLREGVQAVIESQTDMRVVASVGNGVDAVAAWTEHKPDVGLIDLRMPQLDGLGVIRAVRKKHPDARLIVLTTFDGEEDVFEAMRMGAKGYLLKDTPSEVLISTLRDVMAGRTYVSPSAAQRLVVRIGDVELTPREREVLQMIQEGLSNPEIASRLQVAVTTVKAHVQSILDKLGARTRTEAVHLALKRGLIRAP